MNKKHGFAFSLVSVALVVLAFQNCGIKPGEAVARGDRPVAIDDVDNYQTVSYSDSTYDSSPQQRLGASEIHLDLSTGAISVPTRSIQNCSLTDDALNWIDHLLGDGSICSPPPLPPGMVSCMGLSASNVQLSDPSATLNLREEYCNQGKFLCNGNLGHLQQFLAAVLANPTAYCSQ